MSLMRKFLLMMTLLGMGVFPLAHADSAHPVEGKDYQVNQSGTQHRQRQQDRGGGIFLVSLSALLSS